jgi:hypothetical protein
LAETITLGNVLTLIAIGISIIILVVGLINSTGAMSEFKGATLTELKNLGDNITKLEKSTKEEIEKVILSCKNCYLKPKVDEMDRIQQDRNVWQERVDEKLEKIDEIARDVALIKKKLNIED